MDGRRVTSSLLRAAVNVRVKSARAEGKQVQMMSCYSKMSAFVKIEWKPRMSVF